ncbi:DUF2255 family protein [Microbacterium sp.]|uniref:DUF2255 family protein n=1 Tax=Microbacterium sp. TaxID=51671 RepID=UPI002E37E458|nr:DUF2255 family protein [Microbacterium sp.]HEX5729083.1 DUF2255 family protein [Microbacterium sp.]
MTASAPGGTWTVADLRQLAALRELEISAAKVDGGHGRWRPIWVVVVEGEVFVRTWHRRNTGWYGGAVRSGRARIRMSGGDPVDAVVTPTGDRAADSVGAAYLTKYGPGAQSMVTAEAAASTLRLMRAS